MYRSILLVFVVLAGQNVAFATDEVTLHMYPTKRGLQWQSPRSLLKSIIGNSIAGDNHSIGHVNVELNCDSVAPLDGSWPTMMGTTNLDSGEPVRLIRKEGYGFAVMFMNFAGRFYSMSEIIPELKKRQAEGSVSFVKVKVSHSTCARLTEYLHEYRRRGYGNFYGLPNRPRKGEGAGCSAFGASFLDIAGVLPATVSHEWQRTLVASEDLIGGPGTGNWLTPAAMLVKPRYTRWIEPGLPTRTVTFFDPERMHEWVQRYWAGQISFPKLASAPLMMERAKGVLIDAESLPTPTDAFFN